VWPGACTGTCVHDIYLYSTFIFVYIFLLQTFMSTNEIVLSSSGFPIPLEPPSCATPLNLAAPTSMTSTGDRAAVNETHSFIHSTSSPFPTQTHPSIFKHITLPYSTQSPTPISQHYSLFLDPISRHPASLN